MLLHTRPGTAIDSNLRREEFVVQTNTTLNHTMEEPKKEARSLADLQRGQNNLIKTQEIRISHFSAK
jgi:hypothetical protein